MARSIALSTPSSDIDAINLSRALSRLEAKILSPTPNPRLLHSSFERAKTLTNLEYARTLLLRLEHSASTQKVQSRKQIRQNELLAQRALIKRLNDRLYELGQQDNGDYSDSSTEEDLLGEEPQQPLPADPNSSTPPTSLDSTRRDPPSSTPTSPAKAPTTITTTSTLRNRLATSQSPNPPTTTNTTPSLDPSATQDHLTSSLLNLASALKSSTLSFSTALAADNVLLATTTSSLEKNTDSMAAAEKRMGLLRRMSEGQGWWGRMMLYAWIAGLWVVAIGVVFVGPKLRF